MPRNIIQHSFGTLQCTLSKNKCQNDKQVRRHKYVIDIKNIKLIFNILLAHLGVITSCHRIPNITSIYT